MRRKYTYFYKWTTSSIMTKLVAFGTLGGASSLVVQTCLNLFFWLYFGLVAFVIIFGDFESNRYVLGQNNLLSSGVIINKYMAK